MNKKISVGLTIAIALVCAALAALAAVFVVLNYCNDIVSDLSARIAMYDKLADADEIIRSNYYGSLDSDDIADALVSGYLDGLEGECEYLSETEYLKYISLLSSVSPGTGVEAQYDTETSCLVVSAVDESSGNTIAVGAYISSVNGDSVDSENYEELISLLENTSSGTLTVTVREFDESETGSDGEYTYTDTTVSLICGYDIETVEYSVSGSVGYVRISAFYSTTASSLEAAIEALEDSGVVGIIIDVRNTSEGSFDYAAQAVDVIVPLASEGTGAIATAVDSSGNQIKVWSADSSSVSTTLAVLINSGTEGAAELFACDLRDFGKATLVGETTAGYGSYTEVFELSDGSAILLKVAEILPYSSGSFNETGVYPDVYAYYTGEIDADSLLSDEQYLAAMEIIYS